jgi:hypothetical protein
MNAPIATSGPLQSISPTRATLGALKSIWEKFDGSVRALVPLFDQEVRGCAMLREAAQKLMT